MFTFLQELRGHVDVDSTAPFDRDSNKQLNISSKDKLKKKEKNISCFHPPFCKK